MSSSSSITTATRASSTVAPSGADESIAGARTSVRISQNAVWNLRSGSLMRSRSGMWDGDRPHDRHPSAPRADRSHSRCTCPGTSARSCGSVDATESRPPAIARPPSDAVRGSAFIGLHPTIRRRTQGRLRSRSGLTEVLPTRRKPVEHRAARARAWHPRCMPLVALTGGIASGKSTIARRLAEHGAVVVDADQVVRDVQRPGSPVLAAIAAEFGDADAAAQTVRSTAPRSAPACSATPTRSHGSTRSCIRRCAPNRSGSSTRPSPADPDAVVRLRRAAAGRGASGRPVGSDRRRARPRRRCARSDSSTCAG